MTTEPDSLDPDEVSCPRCKAPAAAHCVTPKGDRARSIHVERRRLAARGISERPQRDRSAINPATSESRSKGGKATAQARRRRKAELAAKVEAAREAAEAEALADEAANLAADAARYARDRALLRAAVLEAAKLSTEALVDSIVSRKRVDLDEHGKPATIRVELSDPKTNLPLFDRDGERVFEEQLDIRGYMTEAAIERLAKVASSTLVSLRLEEGKPTGITADTGGAGVAAALGEAGVEELLRFASENLPREP